MNLLRLALFTISLFSAPIEVFAQSNSVLRPEEAVKFASEANIPARYWQWVMNLPPPLDDEDQIIDTDCSVNQPRDVWFLAGHVRVGPKQRFCRIPKGRIVIVPVYANADYPRRDSPLPCENIRARVLDTSTSTPVKLHAEVDGKDVRDVAKYRVQATSCFDMFPDGTTYKGAPAFASGYWLVLKNLTPGSHKIKFSNLGIVYGPKETTYDVVVDL